MADADAEIVALLREIRDLQQAHFAKYCEFTTAVREQQKEALERQQAAQLKVRDETQQFRSQLAEQQERTRAALATMTMGRTISVVAVAIQTVVLAGLILQLLTRLG